MGVGALVGIALIWFVIEMLLWYLVAQFISGWYVFLVHHRSNHWNYDD